VDCPTTWQTESCLFPKALRRRVRAMESLVVTRLGQKLTLGGKWHHHRSTPRAATIAILLLVLVAPVNPCTSGLRLMDLKKHIKFPAAGQHPCAAQTRVYSMSDPRLKPDVNGLRLMDLIKHIKGPRRGPVSLRARPCRRHSPTSWSSKPYRQDEKQLLKNRRRNSYDNFPASKWG